MSTIALLPEVIDDIAALAEKFEATGAEQLDKLTLDAETTMWLSVVRRAADEGITDMEQLLELFSLTLYDSRYAGDFNEDGFSDLVTKNVNKEGKDCLRARVYLPEPGKYTYRWYDASGELLKEKVHEVEEAGYKNLDLVLEGVKDPYAVVTRGE